MTLHIPVKNLASYDDSGVTGHKSCYVSEAGAYVFHVGNSVRNTKIADVDGKGAYIVKELCVTEALQEALAPTEAFERIRPDRAGRMEAISRKRRQCRSRPSGYRNGLRLHLPDAACNHRRQRNPFFGCCRGKSRFGYIYCAIDQRGTCHDRARGRNEQPESNTGTASTFGGVSDRCMNMESRLPAVQTDLPVSVWRAD